MAQRHGEGVRRIGCLVVEVVDTEAGANHELDLVLCAAAVARDRLLDLSRFVAEYLQPSLAGDCHGDALGLPDREGGLHVACHERLLNGYLDRHPRLDNAGQLIVEEAEP